MSQDNTNQPKTTPEERRANRYLSEEFSKTYNFTLFNPANIENDYYEQFCKKTEAIDGWDENQFHAMMVRFNEAGSRPKKYYYYDIQLPGLKSDYDDYQGNQKKKAEELNALAEEFYISMFFEMSTEYSEEPLRTSQKNAVLAFKNKITSTLSDPNTDTIRFVDPTMNQENGYQILILGEQTAREVLEKYYNIPADKLFAQLKITPPSQRLSNKIGCQMM